MRPIAVVVFVTAACLIQPETSAQSKPSLDQLLDRMGAYLTEYENHLSSVVADERFEQNIYAGGDRWGALLESEVAFIRLPGGAEWLGYRDVKRKNWKAVKS